MPFESTTAYSAAAFATSVGIGGDVGEDRRILHRPRRAGRVPADDLDAELRGLLDHRRLLVRVDGAEDDAVRLQRDRLVQRRGALRHRALAVEDAEVPADDLGRFLRAVADALRAAVALVGGDVDDQLLALRLRARSSGRSTARPVAVTFAMYAFAIAM